jgi:hypothetical protein
MLHNLFRFGFTSSHQREPLEVIVYASALWAAPLTYLRRRGPTSCPSARARPRRRMASADTQCGNAAVPPDSSKIRAPTCGTTPQALSLGTLRGLRCQIPKNLSSVPAFLKNVPTKRATPFPASTTEKWQATTDRYRLNIRKRGRLPSANWSAREFKDEYAISTSNKRR